jgi:hypothetical protein
MLGFNQDQTICTIRPVMANHDHVIQSSKVTQKKRTIVLKMGASEEILT